MLEIDSPKDLRETDAIDVMKLASYIREYAPLDHPVMVYQFLSGYSNLTFEVSDGTLSYLVRRPPFGAKQIKAGHDMSREYRVLSALGGVFDKVPKTIAYCEDESVIGASFYVMERVRGAILRGTTLPESIDEEMMGDICRSLIDTLVEIHSVDLEATGLRDFGRPDGYVERQVSGWIGRYQKAKTDEIEAMENVAAWLAQNQPAEVGATLIHNDFKYDNVMLDPDDPKRIIAVLDWEMATVGDPLMDLGTTLAYWVEPQDDPLLQTVAGPTASPGNFDRVGVAKYYAERSGRSVDDVVFYYAMGCYKVAVIGQQIYARFKQGLSKDPRFAGLIFLVNAMAARAERAIETGSIS